MKRYIIIILLALPLLAVAQEKEQKQSKRISPEEFQEKLEQYITTEAGLTAGEAARFFPVYREMQQKQRAIFNKQKQFGKAKPADEKACRKAITERDAAELELKRIGKSYHEKFLDILSPSKVYDVLTAEDKFHRGVFRKWNDQRRQPARRQEQSRKRK